LIAEKGMLLTFGCCVCHSLQVVPQEHVLRSLFVSIGIVFRRHANKHTHARM